MHICIKWCLPYDILYPQADLEHLRRVPEAEHKAFIQEHGLQGIVNSPAYEVRN
jgi:hypothetical protein